MISISSSKAIFADLFNKGEQVGVFPKKKLSVKMDRFEKSEADGYLNQPSQFDPTLRLKEQGVGSITFDTRTGTTMVSPNASLKLKAQNYDDRVRELVYKKFDDISMKDAIENINSAIADLIGEIHQEIVEEESKKQTGYTESEAYNIENEETQNEVLDKIQEIDREVKGSLGKASDYFYELLRGYYS